MASNRFRVFAFSIALSAMAAPVLSEGLAGSYLAGRQARFLNDYSSASTYFSRALTQDPRNPLILESTILAKISLGDVDGAAAIARKLEAGGLTSQVGHMALVADETNRKAYSDLLLRMEEERGVGPLVDGLVSAWAHIGNGAMAKGIETFDAVAKKRGLRGFALYHKALALASVGDFESADKIFSGRADGPLQMTRRGAFARIKVLSQLGKNDLGVKILDNVFGADLDPGLRDIRERLVADEILPFDSISGPRDGIAEVFFSVAAALSGEAEPEYTLLYARIAQYLRPDHVDAVLLAAQSLDQLKRYGLAIEAFAKVASDHSDFHAAEMGRAEALRQSGKNEVAVEVLQKLSRSHADLPSVHVALGDLMRQLDRDPEAITAYDRAFSLYPKEETRHWFLYYARGVAHEQLGNWSKSEADFRKSLKLSPEQPSVLNYLGYSMVERQANLDEALGMIERAVAISPTSGYIIDSLGWVLYRLGRYGEAIGHMERAAELEAVDPIVNDHLGDVLWAVGRHLEAKFQWRRALSFDPIEKEAVRIRQKLEVGLDAVLSEEGAEPLLVADDDS